MSPKRHILPRNYFLEWFLHKQHSPRSLSSHSLCIWRSHLFDLALKNRFYLLFRDFSRLSALLRDLIIAVMSELPHDVLTNIVPLTMNFVLRSVYAHGVLMSLAFVVMFPLGALSIRLFNFKGIIWLHAGLQMLAFAVALSAFGLGVANAAWQQRVRLISRNELRDDD